MCTSTFENLETKIRDKAAAEGRPFLVALDGRSGTGKSTLAKRLGEALQASVIIGDDFYSGGQLKEWANRTVQDKVDYCMDWRRMRKEALEPLIEGHNAEWHTFNWNTGVGLSEESISCAATPIIILDGTFSGRQELSDIVNLSILLRMPEEARRQRLDEREGKDFMDKWHAVWAECEDFYFTDVRSDSDFDVVLESSELAS